jgi:predicted Zn-dependent protease
MKILNLVSWLGLVGVSLWLAGCASNPATGGVDFVLMSEESEIELGQTSHEQVLKQFRVYPDPALQDYVNTIGQRLAAASERPDLAWTFTLVDDDAVNAFAIPGGFIYVTRGMMAYLNSEAELAAVLGHEIGHVTGRHAVRQDSKNKVVGAVSTAATVATGTGGAGDLTNMFGGVLLSGYGRSMELEADSLGARYLAKTNYPPQSMLEVIDILKRREQFELERARIEGREPRVYHGWFASHPDNDTRLSEAIDAAKEVGYGSPEMVRRDEYLKRIDGLLWGKDAAGGVIRGNKLYHAGLRIKITFPEGWRVESAQSAIVANAPGDVATLHVRSLPMPRDGTTPEQFIQGRLGLTNLEEGRAVTVAGKPAYITVAERAPSPYGPRPVRTAVIFDPRKGKAFVFSGAGRKDLSKIAADREFISTIFSFDDLQPSERALTRPVAVRVIEIGSGTTVEALARRSALSGYVVQELRLLNDLGPHDEPEVGQLFKVIE